MRIGRATITNYDNNTKENMNEYNRNWPQIPNHPYRILIIGGSGSGNTRPLLNMNLFIS